MHASQRPARGLSPSQPPDHAALVDTITRNVDVVRRRMAHAAERTGRDPSTVRLVGVSKTFPITHVHAAVAAGVTDLGENRVQEALEKIAQSVDLVEISWHLVGHLQSNKARKAVAALAWIHSVDSVQLLERLERSAAQEGATVQVMVQVDLAGETTKHGASSDVTRQILDAGSTCRAIQIRGLMTLPPWSADPEATRPYFRRLRVLRDQLLEAGADRAMLGELSMGMSHNFEVAIEEGATMVRVGTAIFGRRAAP